MGGNHQGQGSGDGFGGQVDTQCFFGEYEQRIIQVERNKEI